MFFKKVERLGSRESGPVQFIAINKYLGLENECIINNSNADITLIAG